MSPAPVFVRIPGSHHPGIRLCLIPGFRDPGSVLILGQVTQYGNPYLICITSNKPVLGGCRTGDRPGGNWGAGRENWTLVRGHCVRKIPTGVPQKVCPTKTATVSDEEFGTAGVLPAGLTSPEPQSDSSASSSPLSDTPQENVQEVPGTQAPSPALSRLLEQMEYCPTVTPAPSSLTIPRAPLAPAPRPFRDSFTAAQPVERSAKATAFDLFRTGSWPSLCPGRRDWAKGSVNIPLPVQTITWPPRNWPQMTKEQRQAAWQAMAIVLSLADEPAGSFPSHDLAVIMDDYSFLALPGSGPTPSATTPADRAMSELRATNHRGLKYALEDTRDQRHLRGLTQGLAAGVGKGPMGRRRVLELVNAAAIPLRPLRKEAPAPAKTTAAPAKVTSIAAYAPSVPAYSPTRPGLKQ